MDPTRAAENVLLDAFDEVALLLSGTASARHWDGSLLASLLGRLGRLRRRALDRMARAAGGRHPASGGPAPAHPAVELFLSRRTSRTTERTPEGEGDDC